MGTIGTVANNTGFAIYLPGATSLSGADDPALPPAELIPNRPGDLVIGKYSCHLIKKEI